MGKWLGVFLGFALTGCVSLADASASLDVNVINRSTGERLQTWRHGGRLYVAGKPGDRYAVEMRNRSGGRVLAVLAVDGVNAITGQTANTHQSGYVLDPGSRAEIAGWRKSMDDVAAFYFTALPDSYAARTGRPDNVGVIGIALYREYVEPLPEPVALAQPMAAPAPAAKAAADSASGAAANMQRSRAEAAESKLAETTVTERLGTGHGERINAPTRNVEFRRASERPAEVITLYYDSYANLVARGIIPRPRPMPDPFPGGFVPDPRG